MADRIGAGAEDGNGPATAAHGSALRVSGLGKRVRLPDGELVILDAVGFDIAHGETIAIVGASGSGKSTLLSLMFADEPTGNLDTHTGEAIIELLFAMNQDAGTTLVLVTHDEHLAARCSRTLRLDSGRLVADESRSP